MTSAEPAIELVEAVSQTEGRTLIDGITLTLGAGRILGVTGLDGCGKSALLDLMSTLVQPRAGSIRLFGQDTEAIGESGRRRLRLEIGVVFEEGALLDGFTVAENMELPLARRGLAREEVALRIEHWLTELELTEHRDRMPYQLSTSLIRRTALARALVTGPKLLICDEVTTGLDLGAILAFTRMLRRLRAEQGTTIVLAVDDLAQLKRLADEVAVLNAGRLAFQGDFARLCDQRMEDPVLRAIFDDEVWSTAFPAAASP
ncbi:MAG: ATP-binding cassette domain-containing protein [Rhodospirillaceae bacterium]